MFDTTEMDEVVTTYISALTDTDVKSITAKISVIFYKDKVEVIEVTVGEVTRLMKVGWRRNWNR